MRLISAVTVVGGLLALGGCKSLMGGTTDVSTKTILVMGQSNGMRLAPTGYTGWNSVRNSQDTFINCAASGSYIQSWGKHSDNYKACLEMVSGKHIDVIIWYQGESDAQGDVYSHVSDYAQILTGLFGVWREDFGNVPILYAQLARVNIFKAPSFTHWQEIKNQQASIYYPGAKMVRTDRIETGNPLTFDGVHFSAAGDYELGKEFAKVYKFSGQD